jgi:zinc protease
MIRRGAPLSATLLAGLFTLFLLSPQPAHAAETTTPPKKVTTVEGITEYRLDNGLRILLYPDTSSSKVTVNCTVLVGSRHEGYGETGMAHLLEHMVFKGTPTHPDVPKALRDHGAQFNGSTWVDRTNYFETLNASDENLEFAIRLEADRLVNSYVKREDLASEMTVVRNEFESGENSPQNVLSQRILAAAYEWHNYGKSTIGNRSDIERVPIENLQAFYRKYYQPDNVVLVVAGNFAEEKALGYITKYFGAIKKPERKLDTTYTEEPPQDGERTVVLRRVGTVSVVGAAYHIPSGAHEDCAALQVMAEMLTTPPSGRLYDALVTSKKASSVSAAAYGWHDPGVFEVTVQADKGASIENVRDTMLEILEKLKTEKITDAEVERAKARLAKNREQTMRDVNRIGVTLSEWAAQGDWRLFFLHRDRLAKVTPADVSRVAKQYLQQSNRTVGLFIPTEAKEIARATIPETPKLAELLKDYKGGEAVAAGEFFDPTPENIEKRVQRSTLPSGVKVALLPKKSRGEAVTVELTLHFGNADSLKGHGSAAQLLTPLMLRGTKKHTREQLEDELNRLKAEIRPSGGLGTVGFTVQCKKDTLPAVLNLLAEILREPAFPEKEFDSLKRQLRDGTASRSKEPTTIASIELQRRFSPYPKDDVRYVPTIEESLARIEAVTLEEVRKLYDEQLSGQNGEFVAVGDFDPMTVAKPIADALKDWKSTVKYQRIERPAPTGIKGDKLAFETPDKKNAVYLAGLVLAHDDNHPDYAALEMANFVFGGGSLSSRLGNRVRQKEGLSYGVGSQYAASVEDKAARFMMNAICNPENIDKVDAAIKDELEKMLKEGVAEKELAEAKKAYLATQQNRRGTDTALANQLRQDLRTGRTFEFQGKLEKQIEALTPEAVNAAFRKHIDPANLIIIRAGDFTKKSGS